MTDDTQPSSPPYNEKTRPTRAQRRRAARRRKGLPSGAEGRSRLLENLLQRAYPSYEFFIFAAFSGAILGLGYLLDSQAFLLFGILMAPLMSPFVGMILASVNGSAKFFFKTLGAFILGSALVFITGALAGFAARIWLPLTLTQTFLHSRLWWTDLVILALGAILLTASFVRSEQKPFLPSVVVAYELFLPLNAAAFGLASGVGDIFSQGILVFAAHLAWAMLFGGLTLFFLGFRPHKFTGWLFSLLMLAIFLATLATLLLPGDTLESTAASQPTSTLVAEVVGGRPDISASEMPSGQTPVPATSSPQTAPATNATLSLSATPKSTTAPTSTATTTLTAEPTPLYALISASRGGGAYLRREPGGPVILTLANDEIVQALEAPIEYDDKNWVHIKVVRGNESYEGWIVQTVLKTATPSPDW